MRRYLAESIQKLALDRQKIVFLSGPRQVGKTTLSRSFQKIYDQFVYKNWDETEFRRLWTKAPNQLEKEFDLHFPGKSKLLVLDEIHKAKGWKQKVKGFYDHFGNEIKMIVTGSARLNTFKKGGDSLLGRYLNFRLHPFSYGEVMKQKILSPDEWRKNLYHLKSEKKNQEPLKRLFQLSGFPEPYLSQDEKIQKIWRKARVEIVVREDLRDLSRIPELSQVEMLVSLLPEKVGNPLSVQSLREDLEVSHDTVQRWLRYLQELYYYFEVRPWTHSIPRAIKKEPKVYLYDWTEVESNGSRFENLIGGHLFKACHYWTDTGEGDFQLHYLRNKEKQEIDFLISKNKKPWLTVEAKYSDSVIEHKKVERLVSPLKCPFVQVVYEGDIYRIFENDRLVMNASRFLSYLP